MHAEPIYTIGHSDRSLDEFISLLAGAGIGTLVDIRSRPVSKRFPQFDESSLRQRLEREAMVYHWAGRQLGGLRKLLPGSIHAALPTGLRGFADYMATADFERAAVQIAGLAKKAPTTLMCAERDPRDCHRRLIADYLLLNGYRVIHLVSAQESREHQLSPEARRESASLVYDRHVGGDPDLQAEGERKHGG